MTKKILNVDAITNELEGASLFFANPAEKIEKPVEANSEPAPPNLNDDAIEPIVRIPKIKKKTINKKNGIVIPRYRDTTVSRYHDTYIEVVRKAVKQFGKEAATHRFTQEEKQEIADIIYTYKSRGVRTSENEIARIAVNYLVEDFKENGEASVLNKVLKALND